jgi:hypothetical protein
MTKAYALQLIMEDYVMTPELIFNANSLNASMKVNVFGPM